MVGDVTHFSAPQFADPLTTESFWEIIFTLWISVYTGCLNILVFDDGSQIRDTFVEICEIYDVGWLRSRTQYHSALYIRERHYEPIRRTFLKPRTNDPKLKK